MKILSVSIWKKESEKAEELMSIHDVNKFGYFQQTTVTDFLKFTSNLLATRTAPGERKSVKEKAYICHSLTKSDGIGGVLICDEEYPQRVAFSFLLKILDDFIKVHPQATWGKAPFPEIAEIRQQFTLYQDPRAADLLTALQCESSVELRQASKKFYKITHREQTKSCCVIS